MITLRDRCALANGSAVADLGSGTGIFTELLLQSGYSVFAVEPNDEMRHAAEQRLQSTPDFHSVPGTAEHTGLSSASVEMIVVAQAFHWFQKEEARIEFQRILRMPGWVALVWNYRKSEGPFQQAYEELFRKYIPDYNHRKVEAKEIRKFLGPTDYHFQIFENSQRFDLAGLKGRTQSSSYSPLPGTPDFELLMSELERLFQEHAVEGQVTFEYETHLHLGRFANVEQADTGNRPSDGA